MIVRQIRDLFDKRHEEVEKHCKFFEALGIAIPPGYSNAFKSGYVKALTNVLVLLDKKETS